MKAMIMNAPGGPEALQLTDLPTPALPGANYLRVQLKAAGINPIDTKIRKTAMFHPDKLPAILGCDGAGIVEAVGDAVTRFKIGDEIYFCNGGLGGEPGNYAQYTTIQEAYAALKPKSLSMAEAAAVPLALITAWEALIDRTGLSKGQTVLIHAAAGGVGHIAVQLAKELGANVAATVSNDEKAAFAKTLGADLVINYTREDVTQAVLNWTNGQGVDVVFDTVGGETFCNSFAAAKVYGKIVTLLQSACDADHLKIARLRNQSIIYELMLAPSLLSMHEARCAQRQILEAGAGLIDAGKLTIKTSDTFPLAQAAEAHQLIEAGHTTGKIVLLID